MRRTLAQIAVDTARAGILRAFGIRNSRRIIEEARAVGIGPALAAAMIEKESGNGENVWGGDRAPNGGTTGWRFRKVTKENYLAYKHRRGNRGQGGMQGVGPMQLTWWELQDAADKAGGCWVPRVSIRTAFKHLALLIAAYGEEEGILRYNGKGLAAEAYARDVLRKRARWRKRLFHRR